MFQNNTAWFSSSVPQEYRNFWTLEGGSIASWRTADYLFSEDATCPDTLRVFESKDYLWNRVTVFHSLFLATCEKRQSVKSVYIGHYVLPPASVQDEVRNVVGRLIWEFEDDQSLGQGSLISGLTEAEHGDDDSTRSSCESSDTDSSESTDSACGHLQKDYTYSMCTGYVSMDNLQKYSGDLSDFHQRCFQCSNCKAPCCPPPPLTEPKET